jgi:uncharacterized protein (DUF697 family)
MAKLPGIKDSVLSRIWEELKHINYQQVNEKASMTYTLCVAGTRGEIAEMTAWLTTLEYPLLRRWKNDGELREEPDSRMRRRLRSVLLAEEGELTSMANEDRAVLRSSLLVITTPRWATLLAAHSDSVYVYEVAGGAELAEEILHDKPAAQFALSHVFPAFRTAHARKEIRATAMQNAGWALFTAAPNIVPNPGQVFTVPAEALSDFVVLTTNEIKMMFELVALSGKRVQPLQTIPELGIILGLAKLAESAATNLVGKAPGAGPVIKGGVAYAFTSAIGEAIFLYEIAGVQVGREFIEERARAWYEEGKKTASNLFEQAKKRLK